MFSKGFIKKTHIFLIVSTFTVVNSCCSFFRALLSFFCRCLDCLKLKIISLLNSAVLVEDTLSGIQSCLKWAFRVISLDVTGVKKNPNSLHLSFPHRFFNLALFWNPEEHFLWEKAECEKSSTALRAVYSSSGLSPLFKKKKQGKK